MEQNLPTGQASKTGRYFKYAIGEIILVVIGILIALSINNWNEDRKSKLNEEAILSKLVEDLKTDSISLTRQYNRAKSITDFHYDLYLIGQGKSTPDSLEDAKRIRLGIIYNSAVVSNDPQIASRISNQEIRDHIVLYFNQIDFLGKLVDIYMELQENRVRPSLAEWGLFKLQD